jgi:hypothetical protein
MHGAGSVTSWWRPRPGGCVADGAEQAAVEVWIYPRREQMVAAARDRPPAGFAAAALGVAALGGPA